MAVLDFLEVLVVALLFRVTLKLFLLEWVLTRLRVLDDFL